MLGIVDIKKELRVRFTVSSGFVYQPVTNCSRIVHIAPVYYDS